MSGGAAFILQRLVPLKPTRPGGDWYGLDNCLLLSKAVQSSSGGRLRSFLTYKMGKMVLKIQTKTLRMIHSQSSTSNTRNKRNTCWLGFRRKNVNLCQRDRKTTLAKRRMGAFLKIPEIHNYTSNLKASYL